MRNKRFLIGLSIICLLFLSVGSVFAAPVLEWSDTEFNGTITTGADYYVGFIVPDGGDHYLYNVSFQIWDYNGASGEIQCVVFEGVLGGRPIDGRVADFFSNVLTLQTLPNTDRLWINFTFAGESLLHPRFLEFVEYLSLNRKNIKSVGVLTNGVLLSVELIDWFVGRLDFVNISVNGNLDYDSDLVAYMMYRGLDVTLSYSLADPTDADLRFIDREKVRKVKRGFCCEPFQTVAVLWNGDVTVCCHDLQGRMVDGDMSLCKSCEVRR